MERQKFSIRCTAPARVGQAVLMKTQWRPETSAPRSALRSSAARFRDRVRPKKSCTTRKPWMPWRRLGDVGAASMPPRDAVFCHAVNAGKRASAWRGPPGNHLRPRQAADILEAEAPWGSPGSCRGRLLIFKTGPAEPTIVLRAPGELGDGVSGEAEESQDSPCHSWAICGRYGNRRYAADTQSCRSSPVDVPESSNSSSLVVRRQAGHQLRIIEPRPVHQDQGPATFQRPQARHPGR